MSIINISIVYPCTLVTIICKKGFIEIIDRKIPESCHSSKFYANGNQVINLWDDGTLYEVNSKGEKHEILYAHICKRKMQSSITDSDRCFVVLPGSVFPYEEKHMESYFDVASGKRGYKYAWKLDRLIKQVRKNSVIDIVKERKRMKDCAKYKEKLI